MKLRMILTLAFVMTWTAGAHAAADEAATKWLEKLFGLVDDHAIRAEYVVTATGEQEGMAIEAKMTGQLLQANGTLYTNNIDMEIKSPAMGDQAMAVTSRQVSDGTTLWAETYVSAMGITQVGKISLAELAELQGQGGMQMGQSTMFMSPMAMLESIVEAFDVTVLEIAEGTVSLSMRPTAETAAIIEKEGGQTDVNGVLRLREKDASPVSAKVRSSGFDVLISFDVFETVAKSDIPEGTFTYTPEPGAMVVDLAPMLRSGM